MKFLISYFLESTMSQSEKNWKTGGNRIRTVQRLFHTNNKSEQLKKKKDLKESDVPYEPVEVPRYFNFPLKGDDVEANAVGFRNVFTDFNQIVRQDERADQQLFEKFAYQTEFEKSFRVQC